MSRGCANVGTPILTNEVRNMGLIKRPHSAGNVEHGPAILAWGAGGGQGRFVVLYVGPLTFWMSHDGCHLSLHQRGHSLRLEYTRRYT